MKKETKYGTFGIAEVNAERERQINVKGWSKEHDMQHDYFELLQAANCYTEIGPKEKIVEKYPFNKDLFKRTGYPVPNNRDITKAAALLCAELDVRNAQGVEYYLPGQAVETK
jgi:hypothetical protein